MNANDDNLAHQVMAVMDGIRARVWHDPGVQPHWRNRLVDAAGLEAQKAHLDELKLEFQQAIKAPPKLLGGVAIRCDEVDCGDGTSDRIEFWQQRESESQSQWVNIFESAIYHIDFWKQELEFQRLWMDAAFWASRNGHALLAKRLGHTYRLFFGARPILNQTDSSFAPSGRTVRAVADEIRARAFGCAIHEPERLDFGSSQEADVDLDRIMEKQESINDALKAHGLLDNPFANEIGRRLELAYETASFKHHFCFADITWSSRIMDALAAPNLQLAAVLMRLYGHFFGRVYLCQGLRIDRPTYGAGHVPDDPTERQAQACLLDCNRLRAAWVKRHEDIVRSNGVPSGRE